MATPRHRMEYGATLTPLASIIKQDLREPDTKGGDDVTDLRSSTHREAARYAAAGISLHGAGGDRARSRGHVGACPRRDQRRKAAGHDAELEQLRAGGRHRTAPPG